MNELLLRLFVKNHTDIKSQKVREDYGKLGGMVGIAGNLLLCLVKIVAGLLSASISIVADGLHNLADMGSSLLAIIGFKLAGKPADSDHPFGHGRMEYISAFLVGILIIVIGIELILSSVKSLIAGEGSAHYNILTVIILCLSVAVKFWMYVFVKGLGKRINSNVLIATAQDSINDSIGTVAVLISVIVQLIVKLPFNLDAIMAIFVGLFIIYSGFSSAKETLDQILGGPPEAELVENIERIILSFNDFVGIHDLIVHNYGPGRQFASVHVEVPHTVDIVECHEQIDLCEKLVKEQLNLELVIHMDPIDCDSEELRKTKKSMENILHGIDENLSLHDFRMTPLANERTNLIFDVVVPSSVKIDEDTLYTTICKKAKEVNETFCCVITFDKDFTGR